VDLEVVDTQDTSHFWDKHYATGHQALEEAIRALEEEPMEFFAESSNSRDAH